MIVKRFQPHSHLRRWLPLLYAAAIMAFAVPPARATFIITVGNATAAAGSTGNSFDVTLTNTGNTAQTFGAFSFEITAGSPNITFTSATTATNDTYIFNGDSAFGPTLSSTPGQSLTASDASASGNGDSVAAGATVGLGHIFFDVAPGTSPGPILVTLSGNPGTSLADANFPANNIPFTGVNGTITVTGFAATPEPATLTYCLAGLLTLAGRSWWRRRSS